jgi:hypothetical protein
MQFQAIGFVIVWEGEMSVLALNFAVADNWKTPCVWVASFPSFQQDLAVVEESGLGACQMEVELVLGHTGRESRRN